MTHCSIGARWRFLGFVLLAAGCGGGDAGGGPPDAGDAGGGRDSGGDSGDGAPSSDGWCGDGQRDDDEECDDGDRADGDGCDADCLLEPGFSCRQAACDECGNAELGGDETCDDGDQADGDGCDAQCQIEPGGWSCPVVGYECELCGDGVLQANERCDEGAAADGVGCSNDCHSVDEHFSCAAPNQECAQCGDGVVSGNERCDDGDVSSGDGCVFSCVAIEPGWACAPGGGACTLCGDGVVTAGIEECDDGNFLGTDGCSATCQLEEGAVCLETGVLCSVCGNGFIEAVSIDDRGTPVDTSDDIVMLEQCDDGNLVSTDGCSSSCLKDAAFECPLPGLVCNDCGDGVVQGIERCDDGDTQAGNGCSADCLRIEANYNCFADGTCARCGDGIKQAGEACDDGVDASLQVPVGGDGCARTCLQIESGYRCVEDLAGRSTCGKCGNGKRELDEQCDDLNTSAMDGCDATCRTETGFNCFYPGYACVPCGNGVVEAGEECDEGANKTAGCNNCRVVAPWNCPLAGQACQLCGDHLVGTVETCDDGNIASGDGCNSSCEIEPGYECSTSSCLAAACGDGARAGNEECDDRNQLSGDGCSVACTLEAGWVCSGSTCHRSICGDTVVEGDEQCDDGNAVSPGCSASCQLEPGYKCPVPGNACSATTCGDGFVEGSEQCDDGNASSPGCSAGCQLEPGYNCPSLGRECNGGSQDGAACATDVGCAGGSCAALGDVCVATICGDGVVEGSEECDDQGASGVCRGGSAEGTACTSGATCSGGGVCVDGCTSQCRVDTFYRCSGEPSSCEPILEFVAVRRFTISNVSPDGLVYDPARRAFAGHKQVSSQKAIELCLDGSVIDPNNTTAGPNGTIFRADGTMQAVSASYVPPPRPVTDGSLLEAAYDPFTGHFLFLSKQGSTVRLAQVPLCTLQSCAAGSYFQPGTDDIALFQVGLSGAGGAEGLTVGEDGNLYVTDDVAKRVAVFPRRRDAGGNIVVPNCRATLEANCTSFATSPDAAQGFSTPTTDVLDAIFTVPGEEMVGIFNQYVGAASYTGLDAEAGTPVTSSEYFTFYEPALTADPPLYGRSQLPGLLFQLGEIGRTYTKYAQSAETATDGGSFVVCPQNPSEDCQLFARTCRSDADCAAIVPGTRCMLDAPVPYCSSPGEARDDYTQVQRGATGNVVDVLANDSRSESSCLDPIKRVISVSGRGVTGATVTSEQGGSATVSNAGANVTYSAPSDRCGFVDSFVYTANLGGGVTDSATVRVLVRCVCGDGVLDANEQCDLGNANGALPARCSTSCAINVVCGDGITDPGEQCDDRDTSSGDGCSARCTLESACGDGVQEGVEQCDDANLSSGDACNTNCSLPMCGDSNVDVQTPFLEQCDDGLNNSNTSSATCSTLCTVNARCGNSKIEPGERCDDGNVLSGDGCSSSCQVEGQCGNGSIDGAEECDPSNAQSQCGGHACTSNCACSNYCGDARIGGLEQCDDGNTATDDGCRADCTAELCGDGIQDVSEQCDDGNDNPADKCTNTCMVVAICGDGVPDPTEQCDDHNRVSGDGCSSTCRAEVLSGSCGNGNLESGEQCDDGNAGSGDGCSAVCRLEGGICGDGTLNLGEQCDDGGQQSGDGCDASCRFEGCGDGVKVLSEQCDDGNRTVGDGCNATCLTEVILT